RRDIRSSDRHADVEIGRVDICYIRIATGCGNTGQLCWAEGNRIAFEAAENVLATDLRIGKIKQLPPEFPELIQHIRFLDRISNTAYCLTCDPLDGHQGVKRTFQTGTGHVEPGLTGFYVADILIGCLDLAFKIKN